VNMLHNTLKDRFSSTILFISDIKVKQDKKKDTALIMKFYAKTNADVIKVLQHLLII
jgi:hypothetical protein